jgi:hypothetical protein
MLHYKEGLDFIIFEFRGSRVCTYGVRFYLLYAYIYVPAPHSHSFEVRKYTYLVPFSSRLPSKKETRRREKVSIFHRNTKKYLKPFFLIDFE